MAADRHHGVTAKEFTSGVRPIDDISTAVIGMVCTADDADSATFPVNKPVFFSSVYNVLDKTGTKGTLTQCQRSGWHPPASQRQSDDRRYA